MVADNEEPVIKDGDGEGPPPVEPADLPIVIFVKDGMVTEVQLNGLETRALVVDYDVQFPCPATNLKMDADGNYYFELVV